MDVSHESGGTERRASRLAAFEATPILAGDRLFVITPYNQVIALNPGSGKAIWTYDPKIKDKDDYSEMTARGVVVSNGTVFFGTLDARLIALRESDGSLLWQSYIRPEPNSGGYQITSPPAVTRDLVIVESAIADGRTYQWHGRRYVVIAAGGHGKIDGSKLGDAIIAYQID
jgi:quinoprotein glucose dehydrogenase